MTAARRGVLAAAVLAAAACAAAPAGADTGAVGARAAADARIPASGTYTGYATQRGARGETNKDYPMSMRFSRHGSTVIYPTLGCSGRLQPAGFNGARRVYVERITAGHCDDGGTWQVQVLSPWRIRASWTLRSQDYAVFATLTR